MKGLFKFIPVALAVFAMASCSSEDFFGNGQQSQLQKNTLKVEVEDMLDPTTTRAAYVPAETGSKGTLFWQTADQIKVFDNTLVKYDKYEFDASEAAFINLKAESNISTPAYALFGSNSQGWDYDDNTIVATYQIDDDWDWAEDDDIDGEGTLAFESNLPMWGTASNENDVVSVSMKYLTGIFRFDLTNVPGNAKGIKIMGYTNQAGTVEAPMTGEFKAVLATGETADMNAQLTTIDGEAYGNTITVDISDAERERTTVFVPIIAQKYGLLKFYYIDAEDNPVFIKSVKNLTVKRQNFYKLEVPAFVTAGNTVNALNIVLAQKVDDEDDVTIECSKATTITDDDQTLVIPADMQTGKITLNLLNANVTGTNKWLEIEAEDDFAGELVLNVPTATNLSNIFVNLPNASVTFIGAGLSNTTLGQISGDEIQPDKLIVNNLTIGNAPEGATATSVLAAYPNAECDGTVVVADEATLGTLKVENNLDLTGVEINGTVTSVNTRVADGNGAKIYVPVTVGESASIGTLQMYGDIEIKGEAKITTLVTTQGGGITVTDEASIVKINGSGFNSVDISGSATVTTINTSGAAVAISGSAKVTTVSSSKSLSITGEATVKDATTSGATTTIGLTEEGEAISGTLTLSAAKPTLTLTGGYIKTLVTAASSTLTIENTEEAQTGIGTLTLGSSAKLNTYKSTWAGSAITKDYTSVYNTQNIYTASQLASIQGALTGGYKLNCNVDLNSADFTPLPALSVAFAGQDIDPSDKVVYPTIENMKITLTSSASEKLAGMFKSVAATISNFTIKNVSLNLTETTKQEFTAIGALAGEVTGESNIWNVNVNGGSLEYATSVKTGSIGGLVGKVSGTAAVNIGYAEGNSDHTKYASVTLTKIKGQSNMGGIVGNVASTTGALTIVDIAAKVSAFEVINKTPAISKATDATFGTIGNYIGTISAASVVNLFNGTTGIITDAGYTNMNDAITTKRTDLAFPNNFSSATTSFIGTWKGIIGYVSASPTIKIASNSTAMSAWSTTGIEAKLSSFEKYNNEATDAKYSDVDKK